MHAARRMVGPMPRLLRMGRSSAMPMARPSHDRSCCRCCCRSVSVSSSSSSLPVSPRTLPPTRSQQPRISPLSASRSWLLATRGIASGTKRVGYRYGIGPSLGGSCSHVVQHALQPPSDLETTPYYHSIRSSSTITSSSSDSSIISLARDDQSKEIRQQSIVSSLKTLKQSKKLSGATEFSTNSYELERHGRGESHHRGYPSKDHHDTPLTPDVVVKPQTVEDVSELLKFCNQHRIPVVPYGAGTSVEGHVCATVPGTISLDMAAFQTIVLPGEDDSDDDSQLLPDPIARVGAGVTRKTLNEALRATGMQFVVDPGADATIGGMVATGASGTTAVRYGTMRENLLELECVLADGTIVSKIGGKALKSSAGYDLVGLMCGSEGTLGVITSVTVKLHPLPEHVVAAVCVFDSLADAANTVAMLKFCEVPMVRCELLDSTSVAAFNAKDNGSNPMEEKPTLFLEFQASSEEALKEQIATTQAICTGEDFGGSEFRFTSGEAERKALWAARHNLYYASIQYRPGSTTAFLTDACVPLSKFASVLEETVKDVAETGVVGLSFGHAGDGNFHCILPISETDESDEYLSRVFAVHDRIIRRTLAAGGTCTGEHGVGYGKIKYLSDQYGPGAVRMMQVVKQALDPNHILNPGKVVDVRVGPPDPAE